MAIILIIVGIILVIVNIKAIKKNENSFGNVLKYKKEDISEVRIEIAQIRRDVAESLTELQSEIVQLKNIINKEENHVDYNDETGYNIDYLEKEEVINEINTKSKTERIGELLQLGLSEDDICKELSLGKGEVLLVKRLFKK